MRAASSYTTVNPKMDSMKRLAAVSTAGMTSALLIAGAAESMAMRSVGGGGAADTGAVTAEAITSAARTELRRKVRIVP